MLTSHFCEDGFLDFTFFSRKQLIVSQCFETTILTYLSSICALFCFFGAFWETSTVSRHLGNSSCVIRTAVAQVLMLVYGYGLLLEITNMNSSISYVVSMALKMMNIIMVIISQQKRRSRTHTLVLFWLVTLICETPGFYRALRGTSTSTPASLTELRLLQSSAAYILILLQCLSEVLTFGKSFDDAVDESKNVSRGSFSHLSQKLFFTQMSGMISIGNQRPLVEKDIPDPLPEFESERWHRKWRENVHRDDHAERNFSLLGSLSRTFWRDIVIIWILGIVFVAMTSSPFFFLNQIIIFFGKLEEPSWKGYGYAISIFVLNVATYAIFRVSECRLASLGIRLKAVLASAITRKSLEISPTYLGKYSHGELVNLLSVDCDKVSQFANVIGMAAACPFYIIYCSGILWSFIGPSSVIGLGAVLLTMPLTNFIAAFYRKTQVAQMLLKDQRLKLISEALSSIKIIKFHGWEPAFLKRIQNVRKQETKLLTKSAWFSACLRFLWSITPVLIIITAFTSYLYLNDLTAFPPNVVFVSLFLLNSMRFSLFTIPEIVANAMQTLVSLRRIETFLKAEELDKRSIGNQPPIGKAVSWSGATFSWNGSSNPEEAVLRNLSLSAKRGELVAVVGRVGCGKSSLLSSVLGELKLLEGEVHLHGTVAYVPQQAWIQNATIKQNIIFTQPYQKYKFESTLETCCLLDDLSVLPGGENTEIGERGINLSGGQKQRVSLARAVYQNHDIYLLDDPLSAVDAHVGAAIFKNVIGNSGVLRHKTRIFVTNQISMLNRVDRIVLMKNGKIVEQGSYRDLICDDTEFSAFLKEHARETKPKKEDEDVQAENFKAADVNDSKNGKNSNLMSDEMTKSGSIRLQVYRRFISKMGVLVFFWNFAGFALARTFFVLSGLWLSLWSQDDVGHTENHYKQRRYRVWVFVGLSLLYTVWQFSGAASISFGSLRVASKLHRNMLSALLRAPMSFFETTPLGRLLNRFGKDVDQVEIDLPMKANLFMEMFFNLVATVVLVAFFVPVFLVFLIPLLGVYFVIQRTYMQSARQLKRMEAVSRSPVTNHFSETLSGLSSIRAYGVTQKFIEKSDWKVDHCNNHAYLLTMGRLWLSARVDVISNVMLILSNILIMTQRGNIDAGIVGLIICTSLGISYSINHVVHYASEVESGIIASERIEEYCDVKPEAPWTVEPRPPKRWPERGEVAFEDFSTRYREGLELVLRQVSLRIRPGEKIGVVGRTGAGKSSLTLALFRMIEAADGRLRIDGIDVSNIGLHDLRPRLTIIPQDPVIFCGSVRNNLDPNHDHTDEKLWLALEKAHIKEHFSSSGGLEQEIAEGGSNLSMGQRQLICLARAILLKSQILVMDEATAAVDVETDALIQRTVRSDFSDCTIITIAHRLNTILNYDRVIVMNQGTIIEDGAPGDLLQNPRSLFYDMAREAGLAE